MNYCNNYAFVRSIGKGAFGKYYAGDASLVEEVSSGELFIAKCIQTSSMSATEVKKAYQEAELLKKFMHPNIVQYKESFVASDEIVIVMEQCAGGDLSHLISYHQSTSSYFPESTILDWLAQMLSALQHIHSLRIIHRDIKPANIFLTLDGKLKLGDFGVSKALDRTDDVAITQIGTPLYLSPEVCDNQPYTYKSDIWSLGCVIYELATFEKPFMAKSLVALAMQILEARPKDIGNRYSRRLQELIDLMLEKDQVRRLSAKEIMNIAGWKCEDTVRRKFDVREQRLLSGSVEFSKTFSAETCVRAVKIDSNATLEMYEDDFESVIIR